MLGNDLQRTAIEWREPLTTEDYQRIVSHRQRYLAAVRGDQYL